MGIHSTISRPKVSLIIIALNEEKALPDLLYSIKNQSYDHKAIEIIFVDSMSTDRTIEIMNEFIEKEDFHRVVYKTNPKIIQAGGWNTALDDVKGDIIIRLDAHAYLPEDFIEKNVKCIDEGHDICGGKVKNHIADRSAWSGIINIAENSMFGGSVAAFRHKDTTGYVPTLAFAAYKREVFEKVGRFNEHLVRTEDNEMHYRMRQSGYRFFYNPEIISFRETRPTLRKLLRQKYLNGYWIGLTLSICPKCFSIYHFAPLGFVVAILIANVFICAGIWQLLFLLWGVYAAGAVMMSIFSMLQDCKFNRYYFLLPVLFLLLHLGYGVGTLVGIMRIPGWKKSLKVKGCSV